MRRKEKIWNVYFFHDIMNAVGGIRTYLELLEDSPTEEYAEIIGFITQLNENLIDEINSQKELLHAESANLELNITEFDSYSVLQEVTKTFEQHYFSEGIITEISEGTEKTIIKSDKTLLRRVLVNIYKNGLEASSKGDTVLLGSWNRGKEIEFSITNKKYISAEIQNKMFKYSFSTKGIGRGIGTYSVKLLTEKYLGGRISITSSLAGGTKISIFIPK